MINIITGEINSGKTTRLMNLFSKIGTGDGIALPKYFVEGQYAGQNIIHLSSGQSMLFSLKDDFIPDGWSEQARYMNYSFSAEGLLFADRIFNEIIYKNLNPVFIDEIGPLELRKEGFFSALRQLLVLQKEIYITVRTSCLSDVLRLFNIKLYNRLDCRTIRYP